LHLQALIKRIAANARGNVALIVAVCAPLLVGVIGFAADYGYATYVNQGLQSAADAAVLAATSQSAATAGGGYGNTSWLTTYGTNVFQGNIAKLPVSNVTPNFSVVPNGTNGVIATASYSYPVPTFMSGIVGISTITVTGSAKATANPLTYINYYILVDVSQSMGIAATQSDMDTLYNRVAQYNNGSDGEIGCTFACHVQSGGAYVGGTQQYTNEYLAHSISPTVTLRIDSAVAAIKTIISLAQSNAGINQNIKIGLYTMNEDPTNGSYVRQITAPSTNYANLTTLASTIDLGNNNSGGSGDSDFTDQLAYFNTHYLSANGSGASAVSPQNYVFIITDGLSDVPGGGCTSGHCTGALNASNCTALKAKATVGAVYTTYLPIYTYVWNGSAYVSSSTTATPTYEGNYLSLAQPYVGSIPTTLQSCVSAANYYYKADDGPAITAGMQSLFASSLQTAHLTQ
jgi:Flp pilus assembly protein TadG